jgi:hypothetical protein
MTSLLNQSGLNFQNGNPLGRKVRALESQVEALQKEVQALKNGVPSGSAPAVSAPATATATVTALPPTLLADLDLLKRELAMIRAAGYGKGEKGDKGEKGEKGDPGPMTYIAMPANAPAPVSAAVPLPAAASLQAS